MFLAVRTLPLRVLDQTLGTLANTNSRFDAALNHMSQGLLLCDSNKRISVVNRKYIEMYGVSPDVVKPGLSFSDLIRHRQATGSFHGDVEQYCADIDAALAQGKATSLIVEVPGGRSILIVNQPMADGGWVATHEDITERHNLLRAQTETEKLLREQKLQLDTALNNMVHGLCMFDAQGHLVLFNQRYCDMMQLPATALLGRSLLDLMKYRKSTGEFTRDPDQFFSSVLAAVRAGETTTRIMETGGGRSMRAVDHPMANGGWVATFEDITEQRQAERERDRNREFLDQIIENVPVTIVVKDAATRKFVLANRAAERLWSFDRREAIGKTPHDLFPKEKADIMTEHDNRVVQADGPLFFGEHRNLGGADNGSILTSKRLTIRGRQWAAEVSHHRHRGRNRAPQSGEGARSQPRIPGPDHRARAVDHLREERERSAICPGEPRGRDLLGQIARGHSRQDLLRGIRETGSRTPRGARRRTARGQRAGV